MRCLRNTAVRNTCRPDKGELRAGGRCFGGAIAA